MWCLQNALHSTATVPSKPPPVLMQARTTPSGCLAARAGISPSTAYRAFLGWQLAKQGEQLSRTRQINSTDIFSPCKPLAKPLLHTPGCVAAASAQPRPPWCAWSPNARPVPAP